MTDLDWLILSVHRNPIDWLETPIDWLAIPIGWLAIPIDWLAKSRLIDSKPKSTPINNYLIIMVSPPRQSAVFNLNNPMLISIQIKLGLCELIQKIDFHANSRTLLCVNLHWVPLKVLLIHAWHHVGMWSTVFTPFHRLISASRSASGNPFTLLGRARTRRGRPGTRRRHLSRFPFYRRCGCHGRGRRNGRGCHFPYVCELIISTLINQNLIFKIFLSLHQVITNPTTSHN